jgi:His-Xaa-Ser system radical SAM maturase HxsC
MRRVDAVLQPDCPRSVHRLVRLEDLAGEWTPQLRWLVLVETAEERVHVEQLRQSGLDNLVWTESAQLQAGDVVVPMSARAEVAVLLRATDAHHTLFMTNRCNSHCLMCSQPPTAVDDSWLVDEAIDVIRHLSWQVPVLGLTGGEPLLLGAELRRVLEEAVRNPFVTRVEVLSNGRLLSDHHVVSTVLDGLSSDVSWLVPLYGHADFIHDFVVQARGAFDETLAGLLELQAHQQAIQLRIVLIEPVLQVLPELAAFIGRNLPFVREVALMGCEPIGFALANRALCEVNLAAWSDTLRQASRILRRFDVPHLLMNTPLCAIPPDLHPLAHQSISDWKNVFAPACDRCALKPNCSGLFAWHERGWQPAPLRPIEMEQTS